MAIMKWGTPPQGTHHDRQAHVVGHGDNVSLAHAVSGEKVGGAGNNDSSDPNHGPATRWSTAPYKGPKVDVPDPNEGAAHTWGYRSQKRAKRCMANNDTCNAWATKSSDYMYCYPHSRLADGKPAYPANEV